VSINVTSADFTNAILADLGVSVNYLAVTNSVDPITGENSRSYAAPVAFTWVFYKRGSVFLNKRIAIEEEADAYLFSPVADVLYQGDRVDYDGELYEITNDSKDVSQRYMGINPLYNYYTLSKVG
jgi:hypothetical protein